MIQFFRALWEEINPKTVTVTYRTITHTRVRRTTPTHMVFPNR